MGKTNNRRGKSRVTVALQWLYSGSTVGLQWVYNEQKTVRAARADKQMTNKISSPHPSPKERECSNGKVRRIKDEQKTNNERRKDEQ